MNAGDTFSEVFVVTEEIYNGFINIFQDKNYMHTDDLKAQEKGFKQKIMHGNILNGFISYFIGECLPTNNVIIHTQKIQYKKPVYLNDTLVFEAIVNEVFESVQAVEFKYSFKNETKEVVAKGEFQIGLL